MDALLAPADLLILDRQALFCHGLAALLLSVHPDWRCQAADSLDDLRSRLAETRAAIVVIDLQLPDLGSFDGLRALQAAHPTHRFVILSDGDDRASVLEGLTCGARGYICRSATPVQFLRAIETIEAGGVFAPLSLTGVSQADDPVPLPYGQELRKLPDMTDRQRAVFLLLAEGCPTKTIARRLNLAVGTVKVHLAAIYRQLDASGRMEAVAKAHRVYAS
jgi:DNA-binding NarL/FixJ family response regulator